MAYYDPKKAKRDERRKSALPEKPSMRFLADNTAVFYDPRFGVSCVLLNTPILEKQFNFSGIERMTREQAHAVVSQIDDASVAEKAHWQLAIDAPTDADTDAKNQGKA